MKKQVITLLFISFTAILVAQTTIRANVSFGHAPDCWGNQGTCAFTTGDNNKSNTNTTIVYNKENKKLILTFNNTNLEIDNKSKLLNTKLEKNFYLYNFEEDFVLPQDILSALGVKNQTKIKQGNYLVKIKRDEIIMTLQLE